MVTLLIISTMVSSLLMIVVVLLQRSKKDGGADPLTASSTAKVVGINKATDILEQITWVLATAILCFSIMSTTQLKSRLRKTFDFSSPNTDAAMNIIPKAEDINKPDLPKEKSNVTAESKEEKTQPEVKSEENTK